MALGAETPQGWRHQLTRPTQIDRLHMDGVHFLGLLLGFLDHFIQPSTYREYTLVSAEIKQERCRGIAACRILHKF